MVLVVPALAVESDPVADELPEGSTIYNLSPTVDLAQLLDFFGQADSEVGEGDLLLMDPSSQDFWVYDEDYGLQVYAMNPVTSADGLKGVMLDVLGSYDAVVVEYRYQNPNSSSYSYVREIQPDYPWLISAAVFIVVLYCCIRLGAALLCKK